MLNEVKTVETLSPEIFKDEITFPNGVKVIRWLLEKDDRGYCRYAVRDNDLPNYIEYYKDGIIKRKDWRAEEKRYIKRVYLKRQSELPNQIKYYQNGNIRSEKMIDYESLNSPERQEIFYLKLKNDLPTSISYYKTGTVRYKDWLSMDGYDGLYFIERDKDQPSSIAYFENGKIMNEKWLIGDCYYMKRYEDGPNYIVYYEDGKVKCKRWLKGNSFGKRLYRDRANYGPNYIEYTEDYECLKWLIGPNQYLFRGDHIANEIYNYKEEGNSEFFMIDRIGKRHRLKLNLIEFKR